MLKRLKGADRPPERLSRFHVVERDLEGPAHHPEQHRRGGGCHERIEPREDARFCHELRCVIEFHARKALRRVERLERRRRERTLGERDALRGGDEQSVGVGCERHEIFGAAHAPIGVARRRPGVTRIRRVVASDGDDLSSRGDVGHELLPAAGFVEQRGREHDVQVRPGSAGVSHLLENDRQLDHAEPLAADCFGKAKAEVAHIGEACPDGGIEAARIVLDRPARLLERAFRREEIARRIA